VAEKILIVPEPKKMEFTGRWFRFDGFENLPDFLSKEFNVPKGRWKIVKDNLAGNGVEVKENEVHIWGEENVGYATLIQLTLQKKGFLPEVRIEEEFAFKFRGYHLDIARGGVPKVETFKRILRWLFLLKYNYFAIYFEDLFPWKKYPTIGRHRGRLKEEELKEVVEYGKNLGIEVFPSLELSGHMEHILTLPEFRKLSEWHNPAEGCLNLSDEEAKRFAYELLEEVVDFFPSRYIHIGGDETWALGRGRSLNRTWKFEGPKLYEAHHSKMIEIVRGKGKVPILWGDMISGMYLREEGKVWASLLKSDVWRSAVIANWDYSPQGKGYFKKKIRLIKDLGLEQIACPGLSNSRRYYPNFHVALRNLEGFLSAAREEGLLGFLVTAWGDDGEECLFSFLEPLILAAMEIAEGNGSWEDKWLVLSGESKRILEVRKALGVPEVVETMKHILFADLWFHRLSEEKRRDIYSKIKNVLKEAENVNLPDDLNFIRMCLEACLKRLRGEAAASDYIALANIYADLWLAERKPEGLERIISRFWGSAGRIDLKLR